MLRIGLTGGIGSGKTTVARLFAAKGMPVIDTDDIARDVTRIGTPAYAAIVTAFGETILDTNRALDRAQLRARVFTDPRARRQLEAIVHPRIRAEVETRLAALDAAYVVLAVPLLIETDFADLADRIVVVDTDEARQIERTMARSGLSRASVEAILAAQTDRVARRARAHDIITNNGAASELQAQVDALHARYLALALTSKAPS